MDYHLIPAKESKKSSKSSLTTLNFLKSFLPLFAAALILPVFVFFTMTPPSINFTSHASEDQSLTIWFEPSSIQATEGESATINIYGELSDEDQSLFNLNFNLIMDKSLIINNKSFAYTRPFTGTVLLGTFEVIPTTPGEYEIQIDKSTIRSNLETMNLEVAPAKLYVESR